MIYLYARVSSKEQKLDRQIEAAKTYEPKLREKNIFADKLSGKDFNRQQYINLLEVLKEGDLLIVKSIDRLGRDYHEIIEQWRILTKDMGVDIVVLDMPLLDTRTYKDLTGTFIADLVLQILSYVANTERDYIKQRQREGIDIAKNQGIRFGRPCKDVTGYDMLTKQVEEGRMKVMDACTELGISKTQWYRLKSVQ